MAISGCCCPRGKDTSGSSDFLYKQVSGRFLLGLALCHRVASFCTGLSTYKNPKEIKRITVIYGIPPRTRISLRVDPGINSELLDMSQLIKHRGPFLWRYDMSM